MSALANRSGAAAFFCYHSVAEDGPPFLSLPPSVLERQLAVLRRRGWASGSRRDLDDLAAGRRPDRPRAFLTFDDGFADNRSTALGLLREQGMRGIVFVLPPLLETGGTLAWPEVAERQQRHPAVMRSTDWAGTEQLADAGWEIGSHTLAHHRLTDLAREELEQELLDSRRRIAERLGRCDVLAYPFGDWDARVREAAGRAGYAFAFTVPSGGQRGADRLSIPRIAVDHRDDERRFTLKLNAATRALLLSPLKTVLRSVRSR
jgi:peptidoglycan/xylan/chitin deacetylase (PgdA/CDA1 family)